MGLPVLRDDALTETADGFALRLSLPWIRSLPLASLDGLTVSIDGTDAGALRIAIGDRAIPSTALAFERGWWYVQDRVVVLGRGIPSPGPHTVAVSFRLLIPYLPAGPDAPLVLPFHAEHALTAGAAASVPTVSRDAA